MRVNRRTFLLALAGFAAWRSQMVLAGAPAEFAPVLPGRRLVFPRDHGAHPEYRSEWWYVTGWLALADARSLGFQSTFFRIRTGIGEDNPSRFAPRQLLVAHAALADPELGRLRHAQRSARVGTGLADYDIARSGLRIGSWQLTQDATNDGRYRATAEGDDFTYDLALSTDAPPMLNGVDGFSAKASDARHASYYYSRPQLQVAGTLTLAGRRQAVHGLAWLDHEWSSELLPPAAQGWDWLGLNLDDGGAIMAFRLRRADGSALWSAATWQTGALAGQAAGHAASRLVYAPADVAFTVTRRWRSPRTGIEYPVAWRVRIGPRVLDIAPLFDDQELDSSLSTGAIYWEGAVRASEQGREVGRGYLELTGYGDKLRVG